MTLLSTGIFPGLRAKLYMYDWNFDYGASEFAPTDEETCKDISRFADTTLDVMFGAPFARCAARVIKRTFSVTLRRPGAVDLVRLRMLRAFPGDFDFCDWMADAEYYETPAYGTYDADTASVATRRNADSVIDEAFRPDGDHTAVFVGATTGLEWAVTWGTPDSTAPWHHSFALEAMDAGSFEAGWLVYWPVYRVFCNMAQLSFQRPHEEPWKLSLIEV